MPDSQPADGERRDGTSDAVGDLGGPGDGGGDGGGGPGDDDLHADIEAQFSDYYERTLAADDAEAVKQHLAECERCRAAYDEFREAVSALSGLHKMNAPHEFEHQVQETIRRRSGGRFFGRKAFGDRVPFELLAILALIFGIVVFVLIYTSQTGSARYQREPDAPRIAPEAHEVIPRPDVVVP